MHDNKLDQQEYVARGRWEGTALQCMKAYSTGRGIQYVEEPTTPALISGSVQDYKHARSDRQMFFGVLYRVGESEFRLQLTSGC